MVLNCIPSSSFPFSHALPNLSSNMTLTKHQGGVGLGQLPWGTQALFRPANKGDVQSIDRQAVESEQAHEAQRALRLEAACHGGIMEQHFWQRCHPVSR